MEHFGLDVAAGVIAGLIMLALSYFWGYYSGRNHEKKIYQEQGESAAVRLAALLEDQIRRPGGNYTRAKTIVAIRNTAMSNLVRLDGLLNSEIDTLEKITNEIDQMRDGGMEIPDSKIQEISGTMDILRGTWPAKRDQIAIAIDKLRVELRLRELDPVQSAQRG